MSKLAVKTVPDAYRKSVVREYFESFCIAVILALFVRTFVVQAFKIPSASMQNNLLIGDHLLVNKFVFAPTLSSIENLLLPIAPIRRGDIIVFKFPKDPDRDFVKRVIGLPGETVEMRNKRIFINGTRIDEPYVHFLYPVDENATNTVDMSTSGAQLNYGPVVVPPDMYFMMGDNRDNSEDSRFWGFMPRANVKGKALFIYASFGDGGIRWSRLLHQIH